MKKLFLLALTAISGWAFASENPTITSSQNELKKIRTRPGFAIADTSSNGTCMTYGVWVCDDNNPENCLFLEADQATLYTMGLPRCYGDGNYLV